VSGRSRLDRAIVARRHRADTLLGDQASRLEAMSPLAVLGRGYAVAWNADRTRVLRDASDVTRGDDITVTLARGELSCAVTDTKDTKGTKDAKDGT
jgi:exodeoxyribonuclease VII large subunit